MSEPRKPYPTDLSDAQWARIESLIPPAKHGGSKRKVDMREVVNTILYISRSGCQWAMLPHDLLPKSTVYDYFVAWRKDGTYQRIMDALRRELRVEDDREPDPSAAIIDTQSTPTHHQGAECAVDGGKKVKGRKRHIVVDTLGLLLAVAVTAANLHDGRSAPDVLGKLSAETTERLKVIYADNKYRTDPLDDWIKARGLGYVIEVVSRPSGKFEKVKMRWVVERTLAWLGYNRRLSKEYERNPRNSESFLQIAAIHQMLRRMYPDPDVPEFRYPRPERVAEVQDAKAA
jgi:putative transposase